MPGHGVDPSPLSCAEVEERVELYLFSTSGPSSSVSGFTIFYLLLQLITSPLLTTFTIIPFLINCVKYGLSWKANTRLAAKKNPSPSEDSEDSCNSSQQSATGRLTNLVYRARRIQHTPSHCTGRMSGKYRYINCRPIGKFFMLIVATLSSTLILNLWAVLVWQW
jgi:hypothetical protein